MALFDVQFELSDAQNVYSNGSTVQSTDIIDWGSGREDLNMGAGHTMHLFVQVTTAFAGGTSAAFAFVTDTDETITNGTTLVTTPAILTATLAAGYRFNIPLPDRIDADRYAGMVVTCVGNMTAGAVDAYIAPATHSDYNTQVSNSNI